MVRKCTECGNDNEDSANFCSKCGNNFQIVVKPQIKSIPNSIPTSPSSYPSMHPIMTRTIRPGMCYYHDMLPARYICARCGKQMCSSCSQGYYGLVFCPLCQRQITF